MSGAKHSHRIEKKLDAINSWLSLTAYFRAQSCPQARFRGTADMTWSLNNLAARWAMALTAGAVFALASAPNAHAVTETGILSVVANVQQTCAIEGGSLDFGNYISGQGGTLPANGTITYTGCQVGTVNIALDAGQNGVETLRAMADGNGNILNYTIFQDLARTTLWGLAGNSSDVAVDASGSGTWPVYGRIIREQVVPAGTYTDSVNITLTF